ncbi:MAG: hypothetical protein JO061_16620 [Acidobacteriaceae bacterium]|nr:hypothetical protein [Acidobacteriaceae bacterium]
MDTRPDPMSRQDVIEADEIELVLRFAEIRDLIVSRGYTEIRLVNPKTLETRILTPSDLGLQPKNGRAGDAE